MPTNASAADIIVGIKYRPTILAAADGFVCVVSGTSARGTNTTMGQSRLEPPPLFADPKRFGYSRPRGERDNATAELELRDWFVPVLYQRDADPAPFANAMFERHESSRDVLA